MTDRSADETLLLRALELARQGIGLASPNPCVGAVIADAENQIAGTGIYTYAGVKHAEILALDAARERARGGTLYINLEPHAHQGRTAPCTDALIAAGIRRVVASMSDPNPKVSGRGFAQLRAAGVQVEVGQFEEQARHLNDGFARYIRHGVPFVTLKSAMTLDGKIAPSRASGGRAGNEFRGTWITGEAARAQVHNLRHENDAVITGIGTILADNPLLTDRSGRPRRRPLLRVILDSNLRLPSKSRLVQSANDDVLVFCTAKKTAKADELEKCGVRVENLASEQSHNRPDLHAVLRRLAELDITNAMIEAGTTMNGAALAANAVDRLFLFYAPTVFGDGSSVPFASDWEPARPAKTQFHRFGEDIAIEGFLRDPYAE
jgi:diaminohydroxyphosphoribosylaminopyrimidine deaminase/5-amino-6-(5-phosphoribosylamino)uracil reductase